MAPITDFDQLLETIDNYPIKRVAVAAATDENTLSAVAEAKKRRIADPVLVGDERLIRDNAAICGLDLADIEIIDVPDPVKAALKAVEEVSSGRAHIFMKGYIHSDDFLRAVLDKEVGLRSGNMLNHVYILEAKYLGKLLFITDGAMNIKPDLETKARIIANTVAMAQVFGIDVPKVALLSAVEVVNPGLELLVDAALLAKAGERGQFHGGLVDGPFALDNAINPVAAKYKKLKGEVAGNADIIVVPYIEVGNSLAKSFAHVTGGLVAGVVFGASAPVVLPSRADNIESKMMALAVAVFIANVQPEKRVKIGKVHF